MPTHTHTPLHRLSPPPAAAVYCCHYCCHHCCRQTPASPTTTCCCPTCQTCSKANQQRLGWEGVEGCVEGRGAEMHHTPA